MDNRSRELHVRSSEDILEDRACSSRVEEVYWDTKVGTSFSELFKVTKQFTAEQNNSPVLYVPS